MKVSHTWSGVSRSSAGGSVGAAVKSTVGFVWLQAAQLSRAKPTQQIKIRVVFIVSSPIHRSNPGTRFIQVD